MLLTEIAVFHSKKRDKKGRIVKKHRYKQDFCSFVPIHSPNCVVLSYGVISLFQIWFMTHLLQCKGGLHHAFLHELFGAYMLL